MSYLKSINLTPFNPLGFGGTADSFNRTIDLIQISEETQIHELAHIYHLRHPRKKELDKKWEIATGYNDRERRELVEDNRGLSRALTGSINGKYWKDRKEGLVDGPRDGFIRAYGAQNTTEDIATFCGNIYGKIKRINRIGTEIVGNIAKGDPRYLAKLDLLKEFGFISANEYDLMKPHFAP